MSLLRFAGAFSFGTSKRSSNGPKSITPSPQHYILHNA
jgi:hypothetical protein